MKRIALFLITNIAILLVLSVVLRLVGFQGLLDEQGVALNYSQLLEERIAALQSITQEGV